MSSTQNGADEGPERYRTGHVFQADMRDAGLPAYAYWDEVPAWVCAVEGAANNNRKRRNVWLALVVECAAQETVEAARMLGGWAAVRAVLESLTGSGSRHPGG